MAAGSVRAGRLRLFGIALLFALQPFPGSANEARCDHYDPERNVFWGDLHVHTGLSMDAYIFDTHLRPDDAYHFAAGGEVKLPPFGEDGKGTLPFRLERPLDFAAVTDHAHSFGGVQLCTNPASPAYATELCVRYRRPFRVSSVAEGTRDIVARINSLRSEENCGADGQRCRDAAAEVWQETQRAAAKWNQGAPSCGFSTFVAYEHTATPDLTKIHRNVIFGTDQVPPLPISYYDEPSAPGLWRELDRQCVDGLEGCEVLAIPHNPNLSNGQMFVIEYPEGSSEQEQAALAAQRARMEPVVEVMQIKGESECRSGMWKVLGTDEDCDFEKFRDLHRVEDCKDGKSWGALGGKGCRSRLDFARYALIEGMREEARIGVNPYRFGMVASTDIHTGTPGATDEWALETVSAQPPTVGSNLGGLAAVWAEENTRASLFDALERREVYGTSGPRMRVRFFGGWDYPEDLCGSSELVARSYAEGVPMGSDLPPRGTADKAPSFVVSALRDPGTASHPGGLLQRVQIVKGWSDPDGTFHQQVVDVAGHRDNGATVDPASCEPSGPGDAQLCAVWRDPSFDPAQRAVYYARVFENPSCRFAGHLCRAAAPDARPAACEDDRIPKVIQERAWTSPIWYTP